MAELNKSSRVKIYCPIKQKWTIPAAKLKDLSTGIGRQSFPSDKIEVFTLPKIKHFLEIVSYKKKNIKFFALFLRVHGDEKTVKKYGKFSFSIKSADFLKQFQSSAENYNDEHQWSEEICSVRNCLNPARKFIVKDVLEVKMRGILIIEVDEMPKIIQEKASLAHEKLWKSKDKNIKIVVRSEDDEEEGNFMVHSDIVNEGKLQDKIYEAEKNTVEIKNYSLEIVQMVIKYFYHRNIFDHMDLEDALELLRFAVEYEIHDLMDKLESFISLRLTPKSICFLSSDIINTNSQNLRYLCFHFLLTCLRHSVGVENFEFLDKELGEDLLQISLSSTFN